MLLLKAPVFRQPHRSAKSRGGFVLGFVNCVRYGAVAVVAIAVSGCVTDPNTGEKKISRTFLGAATGAAVGLLIGEASGGDSARLAGLGGVAGALIGLQLDKQIQTLREETEGTGIEVEKTLDQKSIRVTVPREELFDLEDTLIEEEGSALDVLARSLVEYPESLVDLENRSGGSNRPAGTEEIAKAEGLRITDFLVRSGVRYERIRLVADSLSKIAADAIEVGDPTDPMELGELVITIRPVSKEEVEAGRLF